MQYQEYNPSRILKPYIQCYYTLDCKLGTFIEDQAFATGCIEVMFTLEGTQWKTKKDGIWTTTSPIECWGQILNPLSFQVSGPSKVLGIRFYPATAALLLETNIDQFNNGVFELSIVVGNTVSTLHAQLQSAPSITQQLELVESYLIKKLLARPKTLDKINLVQQVMHELKQKDFFDNINTVADRYGISSRYLQKVFLQHTGLTPKLYSRINRFQNSLVLLDKKDLTLTNIAYECGYFDQSHFIREFKTFTGFVPSGFKPENSTAILASPNK
jgi:AraC-like DNA-binding protein